MRVRVGPTSIATALMLTAAASARAQISLPSPSVARTILPHKAAAVSAGTGSFATWIVPAVKQSQQSLGYATGVTFTDPTAGTGQSGATVQHQAGTVQVQYPADNQLAASLAKMSCITTGCSIPDFKIQTQVGTNTMTWDLQNAAATQFQMSPAVSVTLQYQKMMLTTAPTSETSGTTSGPAQATYNLGATKAQ